MKVSEIKEIITLFDESSLSNMKIVQENFSLKLSKEVKITQTIQPDLLVASKPAALPQIQDSQPSTPSETSTETQRSKAEFITSPMVGTFYRAPSPGAAPYISIGDTIKKGQTIGIVEAMKIMNEIEAEFDCKVVEIEVNDAQPVEFGTKLVMVERI